MIVGEATTTVSATPDEVFDFVLDQHRYRQADHKIGRVGTTRSPAHSPSAASSGRGGAASGSARLGVGVGLDRDPEGIHTNIKS
jgi:hypothetical protein